PAMAPHLSDGRWNLRPSTAIVMQRGKLRIRDAKVLQPIVGDWMRPPSRPPEQPHELRGIRGTEITLMVSALSAWPDAGIAKFPMQHFLYFLPEPHGQGSLRPTASALRLLRA